MSLCYKVWGPAEYNTFVFLSLMSMYWWKSQIHYILNYMLVFNFHLIRFNEFILLLLHLSGADVIGFDGHGVISYRFRSKKLKIVKDVISLKFRTTAGNGVLLHGEGQQGDYISLELHRARLLLSINLGSFLIFLVFVSERVLLNFISHWFHDWCDVSVQAATRTVLFRVTRLWPVEACWMMTTGTLLSSSVTAGMSILL